VRPSTVKSGSRALIEFYPSDQFKKYYAHKIDYNILRNNKTINLPDERHEWNKSNEMRHVLEIRSVTTEDAGDYRVDCERLLGSTNTACLNITGRYYFIQYEGPFYQRS